MATKFLDFTVIVGGILGCFISFSVLVSPFYKSHANKYLSISLFILASVALLGWYDAESGIFDFLQDIMWEFLIPVTLFTYFLIQIEHHYLKLSWYKWLYFPFFFILIIEIYLHLDFTFALYDSSFTEEDFEIQVFYSLESNLSLVYNIVLILYARHLIKQSKTISKEKKHWLLRLNLFLISIITIWLLSDIEEVFLDSEFTNKALWVILSFLSWWVLYYGVFKLQIVNQKDEIHQYITSHVVLDSQIKSKKSKVDSSKVIDKLYQLMEEEELYKNPLLSRFDIAKQLNVSEGYLSQIINQEVNKSIIQFVNEYRIEFAKKLLHDSLFNKYAVEAIGMEAGFKSKSVFYSTFKTRVGISPGAYRKLEKVS